LHKFLFNVLLNKIGPIKVIGPLRISDYERGLKAKLRVKNDADECWAHLIKCYSASPRNPTFEVRLNQDNQLLFQKLFNLKLRQYKNGLIYLKTFLEYQIKTNFENKVVKFREFMDDCLLQYRDIDDGIVQAVNNWVKSRENSENRSTEVIDGRQTDKQPLSESSVQKPGKINARESGKEEIVSKGYKPIDGNFSEEQIVNYFSFLYKEESEGGKPYLQESEVAEMFKHGLAIPPTPPLKRYKLNFSPRFPKKIVEFCIYKFLSKHTAIKHKKTVLSFFANYIEDFNGALIDDTAMQNWADNVTGKKRSPRMKFSLAKYLPKNPAQIDT
jgi:hypothetical protein